MTFSKREIKTRFVDVTLQLRFEDSTLTEDEIIEALTRVINNPYNKIFSEFVVMLLRTTRASTWDLVKLEVTQPLE